MDVQLLTSRTDFVFVFFPTVMIKVFNLELMKLRISQCNRPSEINKYPVQVSFLSLTI